MLKQEFEKITKMEVTMEEYAEIEKEYMESPLDKFAFCRKWLKKQEEKRTADLTGDYRKAYDLQKAVGYASEDLECSVTVPYEHYTLKQMQYVIDAANDGDFTEDDTICIEYKDGSFFYYNGSEQLDHKIRKTDIKAVIYQNAGTEAFYGECVIINYKDFFKDDEWNEWRTIFKSELAEMIKGLKLPNYYNLIA